MLPHHQVEVQGLGGGQVGFREGGPVHAVVHGRQEGGFASGVGGQDGMGEVGGRGLAFCPGDADHFQLAGGVAIEGGGKEGQGLTDVGDDDSQSLGRRAEILLGHVAAVETAFADQEAGRVDGTGVISQVAENDGAQVLPQLGTQAFQAVRPDLPGYQLPQQTMGGEDFNGVRKGDSALNVFSHKHHGRR